jgi:DnaA family protein
MLEVHGQLSLQFPFNDQQLFGNFQPGANGELLARLEQTLAGSQAFSAVWLWGAAGAGKTHLLNAACHQLGAAGGRVAFLPLAELEADSEMLRGLEAWDLVALDDVQAWFGQAPLEAALLGLYEGLLARGGAFLLCGTASAAASGIGLADLRSRCEAMLAYQVQPLDDAGKGQLLRAHAAQRGLDLTDQVLQFWLSRSARSVPVLLAQLDLLDQASLRAQRAITVPLLKAVLEL